MIQLWLHYQASHPLCVTISVFKKLHRVTRFSGLEVAHTLLMFHSYRLECKIPDTRWSSAQTWPRYNIEQEQGLPVKLTLMSSSVCF